MRDYYSNPVANLQSVLMPPGANVDEQKKPGRFLKQSDGHPACKLLTLTEGSNNLEGKGKDTKSVLNGKMELFYRTILTLVRKRNPCDHTNCTGRS